MKVNDIKFVYRGNDRTGLGQVLAGLLKDMSIEYTIGSIADNDSTHISADLGSLLQTLDDNVIVRRNMPTIKTAIPSVHVRRRDILQWLTSMNIPMGVPITLQFVNDPDAPSVEAAPKSRVVNKPFDWNPDPTEARRREII